MQTVLVTGASGIVGSDLLNSLSSRKNLLVRGVGYRGRSDTIRWRMGVEPIPQELNQPWDFIVHAAASTRWSMTVGQAQQANVESTRALLPLIGDQTHVVLVSTAYSTGIRGGGKSTDISDYRNSYEWSKAASERLLRDSISHLNIVRPPLIIGRRSDGAITNFTGLFTIMRALVVGHAPAVVAEPGALIDIVSVSDVSKTVIDQMWSHTTGTTVTLGAGSQAPTIEALVEAFYSRIDVARMAHGFHPITRAPIVSPDKWHRFMLPFVLSELSPPQQKIIELLSAFEVYLTSTSPNPTDLTVPPIHETLIRSIDYWIDRNMNGVLRGPRDWTRRGGAAPDHSNPSA